MAIHEIKVESDFANKQLGRREIVVGVLNDGSTPSREELRNAIADKLNLKRERTVIVRIKQDYGATESSVLVHEYSDESSGTLEQAHIRARHEKKQKGAGEAKAPSEEKEEKEEKEAKAKKEGEPKAESKAGEKNEAKEGEKEE